MSKALLLILVVTVGFVCCGCSNDVGTPTTQPKVAGAATLQSGKSGVKAAAGGGLMDEPEVPKPGEHVGAPPAGAKSGGGGG